MLEWILAFLVAIGVFVISAFGVYIYVNHPKIGKIAIIIVILIFCTIMWHQRLFTLR